ncbi:thiol reductant ABC exporter subunit CydC [Ornithinimicrobium tianjinense]|uniref:Glutathione/cysteine ABC transporter permease/ATPase n=1 Tax=Ornithinimicrobium tianjinense TaxID=1195761 RepID=A0A917BPX1_9MICO|nr:thiol reductant ABC exporter subunit CydC [Ornithinimicrobium tianjinense]GGF54610.1 glutathione/cysteine ABC transporter permease/ATPase [Ornithinimicrobium tianjinense]
MKPFDPALLRALPETRRPVAVLSAVGVASGVVAIAQALVLALVVGQVVGGGRLGPVLAGLVGLLALRGVLAALSEYAARRAGLRVAAAVRLAVLRRWLGRPVEERPADEVAVTRVGEGMTAIEPYVARYLPALVTAAVVPVLAVGALLVVDPWSALIVVLTLPLLPVFAALIGQHTAAQTERRWGAMALLSGHFLDVVRGLPTLVAYGRATAQVGVVREVGERHRRATVSTLRTAFLSTAALELLATISVAMVAVAVGLRLAYGAMDLVVGLTAILLAPEAYWPVRRVGAEFHSAADGAAVLEELVADGTLARPAASQAASVPTTRPIPPAQERTCTPEPVTVGASSGQILAARAGALRPGAVGLESVSYAHRGRERTVADVTLRTDAAPGLTALTGPSGAGKTTVLELLAGLRTPTSGTVCAPAAHLASQRPVILPGTVRDNLALVGGAAVRPDGSTHGSAHGSTDDAAMILALQRVGLWSALEDRQGLDTVLGDDGFGLSAGQRARLALARATLTDAPLVLLDEPTANVAAASVPLLHEVILELATQRRVIAVTHDPALSALADDRWRLEPAALTGHLSTGQAPADGCAALACHIDRPGDECDTTAVHIDARAQPVTPQPPATITTSPRARLALACLLGGTSVACGVALTATSGWLIVQASTMPVVLTLMVAIVGVRAFGLFRPVLRYAERVASHDVALEELAERRADVFARLVPLTPARLGRHSRGEVLTTVVRDLDDVVDERVRVTVPAWSALIASVVGATLAAWHLPLAGAAVLAGALAVALLTSLGYAAELTSQHAAVTARGTVRRVATALAGQLLAVQSVTGRRAAARILADVDNADRAQARAESRLITVRALVLAGLWLVVAATTAAVAVTVWQAHAAGALSGPYAALVALVPMALADTWVGLADVAGSRARARAAAARLEAVLDQTPAVAATGSSHPEPGTPALDLDAVSATWEPGSARHTPALTGLDLHLPAGSRVALTGPNGVGKSTALAVLARHLDPLAGRYAVSGTDARDLDVDAVRAGLALVDDEPHAFAGTVRANLTLARPDANDAQIVAALKAVDLGWWLRTLPDGLDTRLTGLSGGERARLSMARALLSGRPVLLLDEPAAHLDDATAGRALGGLLAADPERRRTHVMVSHRPEDLAGWDEVPVRPRALSRDAVPVEVVGPRT